MVAAMISVLVARDLTVEGLLNLDPHRGAIVRQLSWDDVFEIYRLRLIVEPEAMMLAAATRSLDSGRRR